MASYNRRQALEKEIKDLYIRISFGASGAPTLVSGASWGAASITRNSAGDYTLVLQDKYHNLKYMDGCFLDDNAQDIRVQLKAESITNQNSAKSVSFFTLTGATPTDPASGQVVYLKLELKNTSAV